MLDTQRHALTVLLLVLAALFAPSAAMAQEATLRLELSPCKLPDPAGEARCGTYSVFENRKKRSGRKIDLKVVVLPATGSDRAPDPIFMIAGGPGQGAATIAPQLAGILAPHRTRRDIVLVDQRGTGASNPLQCGPPSGEEPARSLTRLMFDPEILKACRERLSERADLTQYTTVPAVEDLDEVRATLGYDKVNVMGGSYGSRVALVYLRQHPERVRSAVAWSIAPTNMANPLPFAQNAQRALEGVLADCEADADCRAAFPKVREQFRQVMARLKSGPVTVKAPDPEGKEMSVTVDRGWIAEALRYVLYSEERARYLPRMIDRAAGGDFGSIVRAGLQSRAGFAQGLTQGMLMSVVCSEDIPLIRPEDIKKATEGTFLGDYRVRQQMEACRVWPRAPMPPGYAEDVRSDRPVLLLSGEFDPATSPRGAESAIRGLSRARHLVIPDSGHGWGPDSTACVDRIVGDFLDAADASKLDASCLSKVRRGPFATGGPEQN